MSLSMGGVYARIRLLDTCMTRFITGDPICKESLFHRYMGSLIPMERYFASLKAFLSNGLLKLPLLRHLTIPFFTIVLLNSTHLLLSVPNFSNSSATKGYENEKAFSPKWETSSVNWPLESLSSATFDQERLANTNTYRLLL